MLHHRAYNPIWLTHQPIAHRGLHGLGVPENSLAAFEAAVVSSYAVELDVRLSADHQLVVIHDPTTNRMTSRAFIVSDTSAAVIRGLKLGESHQTIPLLSESLFVVHGRVPILIEVKKNIPPKIIGPILVTAIQNYTGEVAIASFDPRILLWFRSHAGWIPRGQIASIAPESPHPLFLKVLLRAMPLNFWTRPDFIEFDVLDLPNRILTYWARFLRIPVVVWTVKTQRELSEARDQGQNVIFEDVRP